MGIGGDTESARKAQLALAVICLSAAGACVGFLVAPGPAVQAAPSTNLFAGGVPVEAGLEPALSARRIADAYLRGAVTLKAGEVVLRQSRASLGVAVDLRHLEQLLREAADDFSGLRRFHAKRGTTAPLKIPMPITFDTARSAARVQRIKDAIDREPVEARFDTTTKEARAGRDGIRVHLLHSLERLERALRDGEPTVELALETRAPRLTTSRLPEVSMDEILGEYATPYNGSRDAVDRTHNLRVVAERISGLVLLPGDVFDFNDVVGDRTEANGFRPAPMISGGELVDGMGGGACQIAGTLHTAAFFAGLPILERQPHSRPSTYMKLGLDAAVSYPKLNFRFQNDLPFPVVLDVAVEKGQVRTRVWGKTRSRTVRFVRTVENVSPYVEETREDAELPAGVRVLVQRGVPGFTVRRTRIISDTTRNGEHEESSRDYYPPTTQIWRVGTGEPAAEGYVPPTGDTHREYLADEQLELTQGPAIEGTLEKKTPGRTGTFGWTEREKMGPLPESTMPLAQR